MRNPATFEDQPLSLKTALARTVTASLLMVWAYGLVTADHLGGFLNLFLIAGAVMVLVSLFVGRRILS